MKEYSFSIAEQNFNIKGISVLDDMNFNILTKADFEININEFIMLINLILEKEAYSGNDNVVEGTIGKYILLAKYYSNKCDSEEKIKIGNILKQYNVDIEKDLEENKDIINKIKKVGNKKIPKLLIPYSEFE